MNSAAEPTGPLRPWRRLLACAALALAGCSHELGPLHRAVGAQDEAFVRNWIASRRSVDPVYDEPTRGLEGNYARRLGITPLMMAAGAGDLRMVRLLVEGGASTTARSDTQVPGSPMVPFDFAARSSSEETVRYLWERTPRPEVGPRLGEHLAKALSEERVDVARFLLGVAPPEQAGMGIAQGVCFARDPARVVMMIEPWVASFPAGSMDCLVAYLHPQPASSVAAIERMLAHGAPLDALHGGATPLMRAAAGGNTAMVDLLIARGARADARNPEGVDAAGFAANSQCFTASPGLAQHEQRKVALIEKLVNADSARAALPALKSCCAPAGRAALQDRVCRLFAL